MEDRVKAGAVQNVRKKKYANVLYWTVFYTYTFLVASKWFVFEDGILSFTFSTTALYQHIALLGSIIVGFFFLKRHRLPTVKKILSVVASLLILFGAIFGVLRTNLVYLIVLSVLLGQLADCSLLTYIYEMNNAERLYGIVFCHLLAAGAGIFMAYFNRTTSAFWYLMFALSVVAVVTCFCETKDVEWEIAVVESFPKKLYMPLILACIGGIVAVCSVLLTMSKIAVHSPEARFFYYGGAALGSVVYFLVYRYSPKPATVTLLTGFGTATVSILAFVVSGEGAWGYVATALGGGTFSICMMNLYYILCNIIKKYKTSNMLKVAPIVSNFAGIVIVTASTMGFFYFSDVALKIFLAVCLIGDVVVLATAIVWERAISTTSQQEEYVRYDTTVTKAQAYESVGLTDKEIQVAELLLEGLSLREIAEKLFISENTAKTHRTAVYKKMQVGSKEELIKKMQYMV